MSAKRDENIVFFVYKTLLMSFRFFQDYKFLLFLQLKK